MQVCKSSYFLFFAILLSVKCSAQNEIGGSILLNAFKQGKVNNCVSIALIKAAIGTFGLENHYKIISKTDSVIVLRLRNGENVSLSPAEITYSITSNYFVQKNIDSLSVKIKSIADTCFAVMCKREQQLLNNSFEIAVRRLNAGYKTSDIAHLMGLKFELVNTNSISKLSAYKHLIIYNFYHTAYSSEGAYDEALNEKGVQKLRQFKWYHKGRDNEYVPELCDIKEGYRIIE